MKKITLLLFAVFTFSFFSYAQNTCDTAYIISTGTTTVTALSGGEIPLPECAANDGGTRTAGVWYSFTASVDGTVNITSNLAINVAPNSTDTRLHVYSGTCTALTCLGGNDDVSTTNYLSDLSFPVINGSTYLIAWDDRWDSAGFDFTLTETACTITTAPGAVTTPTPADASIDVEIVGGTGVAFSWVEDTTGDVADSFTISIGETITGDDIGSLEDVTSGGVIDFGATNDTTYYWKIDAVNCFGSTTSAVWSFTTESCVETAAPSCPTVFSPQDNEAAAPLGANSSITFTWDDVPTATSYELFINDVSQDTRESGITFTGFAFSTTYTWSVVPSNCFGAPLACPSWTFTTSATLSVEDNTLNTFSAYPNPTSGILNIKSSQELDNVTVFNLLGQNVASFSKNEITNSSIDMSGLSKGLYLVKVTSGDKTETLRVTKD
jgi:hypothetical protein